MSSFRAPAGDRRDSNLDTEGEQDDQKDLTVLLLTTDRKNKGAAETAGEVAEEAQRLGFGLAIATVNRPLLVFRLDFNLLGQGDRQ